ncbi:alpha/beta hydrolase [Stieleria sp. JC731]|uniref:lipase family alpha/beta hydrolase n=1 Tax=Pirellulaceae TaxID=2691357 RepID=UPI001E341673|nr:alpha/beta hydrolase [Stieleria sp. JC731]MCC9599835.1 alpha/beta hydrolase [Stieleria sp. JC731]
MSKSLLLCFALFLGLQANRDQVNSEDNATSEKTETQTMSERHNFNLPLKTAGGTQLWTDHLWRCGFRVQQNALTGHWRLLDEANVRRAWGNRSQCENMLELLCPSKDQPQGQHYVVLLHGLMRTSGSMKPLEPVLTKAGMPNCLRFSYASTRCSIGQHAAALRELLEALPADSTFSFVGHSMGNIVVRHLVGDLQSDGDQHALLPRCKSMVMLGPPNQGAAIARRLGKTKLFEWVTGQGGIELGPQWDEFNARLATPPFPFHIVAGDIDPPIANPLVDGSGDYVVSVEEAKLDGSTSFQTVPVLHSFLMSNPDVMQKTADLLGQPEVEQD